VADAVDPREQVVRAADRLFNAHGVQAVGMDKVRDAAGVFRGVVMAPLDLGHLQQMFDAVNLGPNGVITFRRSDNGQLAVRRPARLGAVNQTLTNNPMHMRIEAGEKAGAEFAKIGVWMASARRTEKPLHPTNLHVNQALFPNDTVQSRLPDPDWLERWLDGQIRFDGEWEKKVVERILHNMSLLLERTFASVQDLNRYRKEVTARLAPMNPA